MLEKKVKVKDLAEKYGLSTKEIIKELELEGISVRNAVSNIPSDMLDLVEDHFMRLKKGEETAATPEPSSGPESATPEPATDKALPVEAALPAVDEEEELEVLLGVDETEEMRREKRHHARKHLEESEKAAKEKKRKELAANKQHIEPTAPIQLASLPTEIHIKPPVVVKSLAEALGKKPNEVISTLMAMNVFASINQVIEPDVAVALCGKLGVTLVVERREKKDDHVVEEHIAPEEIKLEDKPEDLRFRPPIVVFMGHVDHGKTSLQDAIRKTNVAGGEAGGITQHIGASSVTINGKAITFIDTPGHEAFTAMRARGADVTDIAVLVVAADDGFMPQTVEALNHARAAKIPIIVAENKIDLPGANHERILLQMQQNNLMAEEWGGEVGVVKVSAKTGEGINSLLERIILESEMLELKSNYERPAQAVILEAQLEQGLGPTANVLVRTGTLRIGDPILCGDYYGKVKTMIDFQGNRVKECGPSTAVKVVGLSGVPEAGAKLVVCKNEKETKLIAEERASKSRTEQLTKIPGASVDDLFAQISGDKKSRLRLILKTDVRGSAEAIVDSLSKLPADKISVDIILQSVGAITENDVLLAAASKAILVGFHVRVNPGVNPLAKREGVDIRLYSIIYELLADITDALEGRLEPERREKEVGSARILKIFALNKGPKVCGCMVEKGSVRIGVKARVYRNSELIFNGEVRSLRRFQDDVREVKQGLECGIRLENFLDFVEGDIIQFYEIELKKATL